MAISIHNDDDTMTLAARDTSSQVNALGPHSRPL